MNLFCIHSTGMTSFAIELSCTCALVLFCLLYSVFTVDFTDDRVCIKIFISDVLRFLKKKARLLSYLHSHSKSAVNLAGLSSVVETLCSYDITYHLNLFYSLFFLKILKTMPLGVFAACCILNTRL